jgi:hypothetical protein
MSWIGNNAGATPAHKMLEWLPAFFVEGRRITMSGGSEMVASSASLDIKKNNRNKACSSRVAVGKKEIKGEEFIVYSRLYCKRWTCSYCGPIRAMELCRDIAREAKSNNLSRFLTLTLDPKKLDASEDNFKYIRKTWNKFRVYLKRKYGKSISFISVMHLHKSGTPHLHILLDRYIKQSWIKKSWSKLGGGEIVYIEEVKDLEKIGWYLGKYLAKEEILDIPTRIRRFSTSRDIKLREKREDSGWILGKYTMDTYYDNSEGKRIEEVKDDNGNIKFFITKEEIEDVRPEEYRRQEGSNYDKEQIRSN